MLAEAFVAELLERARLYAEGDVKLANAAFNRSRVIAAEIMADREAREDVFRRLTTHDCEDVVVSAAAYLLPIDEAFAVNVLQRVDELGTRPENRISAHFCIAEWKAGRMDDVRALK
ncbi:MAG: hypothetical protein CMN73_01745 [Sphingomonas sp.]|nr:hypothetical protein [Sphingomonas sp.]